MKRGMLAVIVIVIIVAATILLTPIALAGAVTVPQAQITFTEDTSGGPKPDLGGCVTYIHNSTYTSPPCTTASSVTVYEYYFLTRPGGMLRTSDTSLNNTGGSANITISMVLSPPTGQSVNLGNMTISGAVGTRTHTLYLSIDQGVRASGIYTLTVSIDSSVKLAGASSASKGAVGFETTFKVS
jgi:hypothetical protein